MQTPPHGTEYSTITPDGTVKHADGADFAYLPAPTVQSHAANLLTLPDGRLGCVWFGGTQEGVPDISIWFSTLEPGSTQWSPAEQLSDDGTRSEQNPILFTAPGHLSSGCCTPRRRRATRTPPRSAVGRPRDSGRTWGPVETLFPANETGGVFVRQLPVVLPSGRLIIPIFRCITTPGEKWVGNSDDSAVMISDDGGATWTEHVLPGSLGCVHMNIQPVADGSLLALFRSRWADSIYESRSTDDGTTWSEPVPTELPNNNSSIQFTALADGRLALVYNHSRAEENTERRLSLYDEIDDDGLAEEQGQITEPAAPAGGALSGDGAAAASGASGGLLGHAALPHDAGDLRGLRPQLAHPAEPRRGRRLLPVQQLPRRPEPRILLPVHPPGPGRRTEHRLHLLPPGHQVRARGPAVGLRGQHHARRRLVSNAVRR